MEAPQHCGPSYCRARKLGSDIVCDAGQSQHADMEHLSGGTHRFQIFTAEMMQAELYFFSGYCLLDRLSMPFELITDGSADNVGAVRVKPFLNQQINLTEIDVTQVDRDFLAIRGLGL